MIGWPDIHHSGLLVRELFFYDNIFYIVYSIKLIIRKVYLSVYEFRYVYNKQCQFTMNNNVVLIYYLVFSTFLLKRHSILFASSTLRKSKCKSLIIIKRNKLEFERKETCSRRPLRFEIFFYKMILC